MILLHGLERGPIFAGCFNSASVALDRHLPPNGFSTTLARWPSTDTGRSSPFLSLVTDGEGAEVETRWLGR